MYCTCVVVQEHHHIMTNIIRHTTNTQLALNADIGLGTITTFLYKQQIECALLLSYNPIGN